jgi:hypothetical protein
MDQHLAGLSSRETSGFEEPPGARIVRLHVDPGIA